MILLGFFFFWLILFFLGFLRSMDLEEMLELLVNEWKVVWLSVFPGLLLVVFDPGILFFLSKSVNWLSGVTELVFSIIKSVILVLFLNCLI